MAARRLIIMMVILLGVSTLLAAALPDRVRDAEEERTASEASTATTATEAEPGATEAVADERASGSKRVKFLTFSADKPKIFVIPLEARDQLSLTVVSSADDLVEILGLGFIDVVGPGNPATFDVFADQPGTYGIKLVDADRTIGRLEVADASAAKAAQGPE